MSKDQINFFGKHKAVIVCLVLIGLVIIAGLLSGGFGLNTAATGSAALPQEETVSAMIQQNLSEYGPLVFGK